MPFAGVTEQALLGYELGKTNPTIPTNHYCGLIAAASRANGTAYTVGQYIINPTFPFSVTSAVWSIFKCTTAGTTAGSAPGGFAGGGSAGGTITDNTATWTEVSALFAAGTFLGAEPCQAQLTAATGTSPITTLACTPLTKAIGNGDTVNLTDGSNTQNFTANGTAALNATSITITSATPAFNYPAGTPVNDTTSGNGYARSGPITNNTTNWPAPSGTDPAQVQNGTALAFPTTASTWGQIAGFVLLDGNTGSSNARVWGLLTSASNVATVAGVTPDFAVSGLTVTLL